MDTSIHIESDRRIVRVGEWTFSVPNGSEEPLVEDVELARRSEYARPRAIRALIKRLIAEREITDVCERHTVERSQTPTGGAVERTITSYWLTEEQALVVVMHSKTSKARAIRKQMIAVFRAAMRGLLVPASHHELEAKVIALTAKVQALELGTGGVIGDRDARRYILTPIAEAARALCVAVGDTSTNRYRSCLKDLEIQLRMHVQFPAAAGQKWANLPIARLGDAQCKVAELNAKARKAAAPFLKLAQTDMFKALAERGAMQFSVAGDG